MHPCVINLVPLHALSNLREVYIIIIIIIIKIILYIIMNLTQQLSEDVFVLVVRVDIQHLRKCTVDKLKFL